MATVLQLLKLPDGTVEVLVEGIKRGKIKRFIETKGSPNLGIRLAVKGGGCSGLSYHLDYDEPKEKDHIIRTQDIMVLIDRKSAIYLKGMSLDFQDSLNSRGFKFINPNATNTCGCGESFSV